MVLFRSTALLVLLARLAASQSDQTTWGSVVFVYSGESTPILTSNYPNLTPLGAQQAFNAGATIRSRYVVGPGSNVTTSYPIRGIASNIINNSQLGILARDQSWVVATGLAFLQGLYPLLGVQQSDAQSTLADGTLVQNPLNGYQYAYLSTASVFDFQFKSIAGDVECSQYELSAFDYFENSPDFASISQSSAAFYQRLIRFVYPRDVIPPNLVKYLNAYVLWEYANYQYTHNATIARLLNPADLAQLRSLASQREFALNGNLTASGRTKGDAIRTIAGQTLAGTVLDQLANNIVSRGQASKLTLLFGSFEPFLAFFALSQLASHDPAFQSLPQHGSTMMFELFSPTTNQTFFPNSSQLFVRFLFRNGTSPSSPVLSYPLFGLPKSQADMSWFDFRSNMSQIALNDVGSWCMTCDSLAVFCPFFLSNIDNSTNNNSNNSNNNSNQGTTNGISNSVAGVIGAVVTLLVACIVVAAAIFCCGVSVARPRSKRNSTLGGFKGAGKLEADKDVNDGVDVKNGGAGGFVPHHERVGSWELAEANKDEGGPSLNSIVSRDRKSFDNKDRVVSNVDYNQRDREMNEEMETHANPFADPVTAKDMV